MQSMVAVVQEDACSICYGDMHERGTKFAPELVWCQQGCGHSVHARCLNVWAKHQVTHVLKAASVQYNYYNVFVSVPDRRWRLSLLLDSPMNWVCHILPIYSVSTTLLLAWLLTFLNLHSLDCVAWQY